MTFIKKVLLLISVSGLLIVAAVLFNPSLFIRIKHHAVGVSYELNQQWLDDNQDSQIKLQYVPKVVSYIEKTYASTF